MSGEGAKAAFMQILLTRVRVTDCNISGASSPGDVRAPYENFPLGFEKIEWVYITAPSQECRTDWVNDAAMAVP